MELGYLGGRFDTSSMPSRLMGNMKVSPITGLSDLPLNSSGSAYGWGDSVYVTVSGIKYNVETDEMEKIAMPSGINGAMCAVNGDRSSNIHYLTYPYTPAQNITVIDLETKTTTKFGNDLMVLKPSLPVLVDEFIYYASNATSMGITLIKIDISTQTKTSIPFSFPKNINKGVKSITYAGDNIFYITFANIGLTTSTLPSDQTVTLIKVNELTMECEIIHESIPIKYKYQSVYTNEYEPLYLQHGYALFTHLEANRIYLLTKIDYTSKASTLLWSVLDIDKGVFTAMTRYSTSNGYIACNVTYTDESIFFDYSGSGVPKQLAELEFQKD